MKILYLIRHGKTRFNEEKRYCGFSDISLSAIGLLELKNKKERTSYPKANKYFTSGMKRTDETLKYIYGDIPFESDLDFREYNFGEFEGHTYEELKDDRRYIDWILDNEGIVKCPRGESKNEFFNRIYRGFKALVEDSSEEIVVVCHGGVIGILLEKFSNRRESFYELQPSCGGGYKIEVLENFKINILEEF